MRRIGFLNVERGDNLGDPEFWNRRFDDIDLRLHAAEELFGRIDGVLDEVIATGLARLNDTLTPLINNAYQQIAAIPQLFVASSATSLAIGTGSKTFVIQANDRDTWVTSQMVFARVADDPTKWMLGDLVSFDRSTGEVVVNVVDTSGSGTFGLWSLTISGRRGPQGEVGPQGLAPRGVYSSITQYQPRDVVRYDRSAWVAKIATLGNAPPTLPLTSNAQWELLVERGADGLETGAFETVFSETVNAGPKTTFTITGGYSPAASMLVFLNGILLTAADYTATNGTTVVLTDAAATNDVFEFRAYAVFGVGDVPKLDLNASDYPDKDALLANIGGTTVGRSIFKAADQAAVRTAAGAAAASHSHSDATSDASGFMAAGEKVKLAGIEAGAQVNRPIASQAEAQGGSENTKAMTALRVRQALDARKPSGTWSNIGSPGAAFRANNRGKDILVRWTGGGTVSCNVETSPLGDTSGAIIYPISSTSGTAALVPAGWSWRITDQAGTGSTLQELF